MARGSAETEDELRVVGHLVRRPRRIERQLEVDLLHPCDLARGALHVACDERRRGAAHRREAVEDLHLRPLDLDVVHEAEIDDVHPELGILDLAQHLEHFFLRRHKDQCRGQNPISRTSSRRSRAKKWIPSTKRTQLQRVHMSSEYVRALSARKRTPCSRSPLDMPVAATITSPGARSSVRNTRP